MNITPSVFDKPCPHCGKSLEKQLRQQAHETGYGYRESGEFLCIECEGEVFFRFEWGVVWSEVNAAKTQPTTHCTCDLSDTPEAPAAWHAETCPEHK